MIKYSSELKYDHELHLEMSAKLKEDKRIRTEKQMQVRNVYDGVMACATRSLRFLCQDIIQIPRENHELAFELTQQYGYDKRSWRAWFRSFVHNLSTHVPAWGTESVAYLKVYHVVDQLVADHTNRRVLNFQVRCFERQFEIAKQDRMPPTGSDIWRRIHLLACSPFWRGIACEAVLRMAALAAQDEAARLGVDSVVEILPDQATCFFPPVQKEWMALMHDRIVRSKRAEYEARYDHEYV